MATPRVAWGIDVGNRALKAIKLVREGDQVRIDDFDVVEHEQILSQAGDNKESLVQSALANFAQRHNTKGTAVAIGVSGQASFARFIKLPPVEPSKIPDIVRFEAVQQIPFPLDEVEWAYQLFQSPENPEVEVGIFAMRKDLVDAAIKNFTDVGIEINAVQTSPLAVYNGLQFDGKLDGATMIVDVGAENSDLLIAEGENVWMRSLPVGGNNFTEALVKAFKLKFPKAEELKRNAATSKYGRQILQAMKPVFADLVGEIQRSVGFYSSTHADSRISKVLALGGTFRLPGLQKYLQQNLQLEVARLDRLNAETPADARFAAAFNENILSSIGAYGLAVQAMNQSKIKSSLLPERIRRERMWREKTKWFSVTAAMFVVGTTVAFGRHYVDSAAYTAQYENQKASEAIVSEAQRYDGAWKKIESSGADDRRQIANTLAVVDNRDTAIDLATNLLKAFPPASAEELKLPRAQRTTVELASWAWHYRPDCEPLLSASRDEFNGMFDKLEMLTGTTAANTSGAVSGAVGRAFAANQGEPKRGFLITMLVRTPPCSDPIGLVNQKILPNLSLIDGQNIANLKVARVQIPSTVKLSAAMPTGVFKDKRPALDFQRPAGGNAADPNAGAAPPAPAGANAVKADPFEDPMHPNETLRDDSLVTVLAVVLIDPPKVAPKATPNQKGTVKKPNAGAKAG